MTSDSNTSDLFSVAKGEPQRSTRGRPRKGSNITPKVHITLRVDTDVLEAARHSGPGWQTRINDLLRETFLDKNHGDTVRQA
ncbi:hypothetical protein D3W54_15900 (plasmid) [Komagataeibacter medellinensis]|uniref:BrnA antitoxin of type II toxin-antitoxin system n=1 Tax=Komagataeibacter medellinensis TaxID=1177712 RepID=A0ABQ6VQJ9_9PROT|nr:BrnA antitoxin family protein [Komagataeibacter medellinensis]KAB8122191.1 hypothetical protein D3W54_15900 [Komagataeibacter medellinensis]